MAKKITGLKDERQKGIVKLIDSLCGRFSRWEVWQDFIIMSALSIANALGGPYKESREKQYIERAKKYSPKELETFAEMLAEVVVAMERNPDQDFLGELFMALELGNEWKGQFFTPYSVCRAMAAINYGADLEHQADEKGWISVNDPACGAGALLIAFANECRRPGHKINYQTSVLFVAQDIDYLAGMMCYIQLSLLGCPGYVIIRDTLSQPSTSRDRRGLIPNGGPEIWYTPMYFRDIWAYRCLFAQIDMLSGASKTAPKETPAPKALSAESEKDGQLTLF